MDLVTLLWICCVALGVWLACVSYMLRAEFLETQRDGKTEDAENSYRLVKDARDRRRAGRDLRDR